jgi:hypothetical protein
VRFWRNNGFVFGFESGSFLLDKRSRKIVSIFKQMICDFDLLENWLRLYKKHFFLKRGSLISFGLLKNWLCFFSYPLSVSSKQLRSMGLRVSLLGKLGLFVQKQCNEKTEVSESGAMPN